MAVARIAGDDWWAELPLAVLVADDSDISVPLTTTFAASATDDLCPLPLDQVFCCCPPRDVVCPTNGAAVVVGLPCAEVDTNAGVDRMTGVLTAALVAGPDGFPGIALVELENGTGTGMLEPIETADLLAVPAAILLAFDVAPAELGDAELPSLVYTFRLLIVQ